MREEEISMLRLDVLVTWEKRPTGLFPVGPMANCLGKVFPCHFLVRAVLKFEFIVVIMC